MKQWHARIAGLISMLVLALVVLGAAVPDRAPVFHERKEVAGLAIVFGAEPEPALNEEIQFLRWRVSSLDDEQPYVHLTDAQVRIAHGDRQFGPFMLRPVRGAPGQYETRHIFTEPGTYESVLSFRKGEETTVHRIDFGFTINDRADIEIAARDRSVRDRAADSAAVVGVVAAFHDALARGDGPGVLGLMTTDAKILEGGGIETVDEYASHHLPADVAFARAVPRERGPVAVEVVGDVAWAVSTSRATGSYGGREIDSRGAELVVLSRRGEAWRIEAIHWSAR